MPKNTTQCSRPELDPNRSIQIESSAFSNHETFVLSHKSKTEKASLKIVYLSTITDPKNETFMIGIVIIAVN